MKIYPNKQPWPHSVTFGTIRFFYLLGLVLGFCLGLLVAAVIYLATVHVPTFESTLTQVITLLPAEEDEPRWDCRTMGNLTCGPDFIFVP